MCHNIVDFIDDGPEHILLFQNLDGSIVHNNSTQTTMKTAKYPTHLMHLTNSHTKRLKNPLGHTYV